MQILTEQALSANFTTKWYNTGKRPRAFKFSLQIDWSGVAGTELDGNLYIEISLKSDDNSFATLLKEITINKAATGNDDYIVNYNTEAAYAVRLRYVHNNISAGIMNCELTIK